MWSARGKEYYGILKRGDRRLCTQCLVWFKARPRLIGHATRVTHASLDCASMVRPTIQIDSSKLWLQFQLRNPVSSDCSSNVLGGSCSRQRRLLARIFVVGRKKGSVRPRCKHSFVLPRRSARTSADHSPSASRLHTMEDFLSKVSNAGQL